MTFSGIQNGKPDEPRSERVIKFRFAGTVVNVTQTQRDQIKVGHEVETVYDAIAKIDSQYDNKILPEIENGFQFILKCDGGSSRLISIEKIKEAKLGNHNEITFFYPFKGG